MFSVKINWDALGVGASLACAIHCAIVPFVVAGLPVVGANFLQHPILEYGLLLVGLILGLASLRHGFQLHHHKALPIVLFLLGMFLVGIKDALPINAIIGWAIIIIGAIAIIAAHWLNFRLCRKANHCHAHDCNH